MPQNAPTSSDVLSEPDSQLNDRQLAAIDAILQGLAMTQVAQAVGVDRKTLYRWRIHDLAFATELRERRREAIQLRVDRLCNLLDEAMDVLQRQMHENSAPISHRAARTLLVVSGIGKSLYPPTKAKPQPAGVNPSPARPELTPSAARALARAVNSLDLLGVGAPPPAGAAAG